MNWKATVAMLAIALAVVWFYFQDVEKVEQEKQAEKEKEQFIVAEAKDIMSITVERPGAKTIAAVRQGEEWRLTEPVDWPADKFAWDAVASSMASAKVRRTFPDEGETLTTETLEKWGLTPPGLTVRATIRDGSKEFSYGFGNKLPGADSSIYATSSALADKALVVPTAIVSNASKDLHHMREKKYLNVHFERDNPSLIEVSNQDIQLSASREGGDAWTITSPEKVKGDPANLRKYVEKLGLDTIKIIDEVDDAKLTSVGLADDQIASATRYSVGFGEGKATQTFYIGKFDPTEGGRFGRREGTRNLFIVSPDFFDGQPKALDELRPTKAILVQKWNAEVVSATSNGQPLFNLRKEDFKWHMTSPYSASAEREAVDKLVDAFNDFKITSYNHSPASDEELGLSVPILSLSIKGEKGTETIHIGKPDGLGGVHVAWEGLPDRFTMDYAILDRILVNPLDLLTPAEKERVAPSTPAPATGSTEGGAEVLDLTGDAPATAEESAPAAVPDSASGETPIEGEAPPAQP